MTQLGKAILAVALIGVLVPSAASSARADIILQQYEFQGQPGNQTSVSPSFVASGLSGLAFAESGLTPAAALNSISATGWNKPGVYFSFGFNIQAGFSVTVDQIILASRSSGTGPGFLNVLASADGGTFATVASFAQTGTNFNDEFLAITPVTALHSLTFEIVVSATNQNSANGGAIGSTGTFRVGDYNPSGTPTPFTINGTLSQVAAVPEPASIAMTGLGLLGLVGLGLRRKALPVG